jgi:hypothetical protein
VNDDYDDDDDDDDHDDDDDDDDDDDNVSNNDDLLQTAYLRSQISVEAHIYWSGFAQDSPHFSSEHTTRQDSIKGVPYA